MSQTEVQLIKASAVVNADIADQAVTLDKLVHGTSSNNGKFLRANNGADPTFETVTTDLVADTTPQLGGSLDVNDFNILNGTAIFDITENTRFEFNIGGTEVVDINGGGVDITSGHVVLVDNVKAKIGSGTDLEIYHDGTDSYVDNNNGDLYLTTTGSGDDVHIRAVDDVQIKVQTSENAVICTGNGSVDLYYNGSKTFETKDLGAIVSNPTGSGNRVFDVSNPSNDYCFLSLNDQNTTNNGTVRIGALANEMLIYSGGNHAIKIDSNGHFLPATNNTFDLGSSSLRWRNIYTNDLNLSNKGSTNDVDGTWGDYTIQEGAEDLFLINKRNGKKFKFNLTEVA